MQPTSNHSRRPTVAVVEADPAVLSAMTKALESKGLDVIAVTAAEDVMGLAFMDVEMDLLFTEIGLAGPLDGWELAETMREMLPGLPVIYTSAQPADSGNPLRVTDAVFVPKPYDALKVCALIERHAALRMEALATAPVQRTADSAERAPLQQTA
jgi:DNA-binding NtrC family response regulator